MAGRPELAAAPPIQNVVVYVSNDNFAQAFSVTGQPHNASQNSPFPVSNGPPSTYQNSVAAHPMVAPMVANFQKTFDKTVKPDYPNVINDQSDYYHSEVLPQQFDFQNPKTYAEPIERPSGPGRPADLDPVASFEPRCDSVRSETTESSCSSGSSADENIVIVRNHEQEMVVYDAANGDVRPGGVVLTVNGQTNVVSQQQTHGTMNVSVPCVTVPFGWKRILNNGSIIYISPSNTALNSLEQTKEYLLSSGTCKCGLECHFKYDNIFNFDPKVISKPWSMSPDRNPGDMTKLCNHKRKIIAMASMDSSRTLPSDIQYRKDCNAKRKKRKLGVPFCGNLPMSSIPQFEKGQHLSKEIITKQQVWPQHHNQINSFPPNRPAGFMEACNVVRYPQAMENRLNTPPSTVTSTPNLPPRNMHHPPQPMQIPDQLMHPIPNNQMNPMQHRHLVCQNGPVHTLPKPNQPMQEGHLITHPGETPMLFQQGLPQKVYAGEQPSEPTGPGRPGVYGESEIAQRNQGAYQIQRPQNPQMIPNRAFVTPNGQMINNFKPNVISQDQMVMMQQQKWQQKMIVPSVPQHMPSIYERVPPLHQPAGAAPMIWNQDEPGKKKNKIRKGAKNRPPYAMEPNQVPCPNIDVRHMPGRSVMGPIPHNNQSVSSPSFMEDPSGYLAQQTALLNSTINRQTGETPSYNCKSPLTLTSMPIPPPQNEISLQQPHSVSMHNNKLVQGDHRHHMNGQMMGMNQGIPDSSEVHHPVHCQGCVDPNVSYNREQNITPNQRTVYGQQTDSQPSTPSSSVTSEDPVTSSTFFDKQSQDSPDSRPIQGGTVSTSNVSPADGLNSGPPTPNSNTPCATPNSYTPHSSVQNYPQTPLTPNSSVGSSTVNLQNHQMNQMAQQFIATSFGHQPIKPAQHMQHHHQIHQSQAQQLHHMQNMNQSIMVQKVSGSEPNTQILVYSPQQTSNLHQVQHIGQVKDSSTPPSSKCEYYVQPNNTEMYKQQIITTVVTTMASGRTVGSNTITSVLAGRSNPSTVSISNSPQSINTSSPPIGVQTSSASKSPLEMVQSVVSSIQVPQSQSQMSPTLALKSAQLPPGHVFVSSGNQLIVAASQSNVMPPPPPKVVTNQPMPPISVSPIVTNVTAAMTQMIPAVAPQVLGQQTVLVNALSSPFVIQPGVTMTMDGVTVGQNMQIPQIVTGNVIQPQIQIEPSDPRRANGLISPENKKKGKRKKIQSQQVAGMLQLASPQGTSHGGIVMSQQSFPQQIQMAAHSPQGLTAGQVMQALTIVPNKSGAPQIVMNGQANLGTQQIITNSQHPHQFNLLQPVNLINGTAGVVQNFPTIQQFIVPNLGGMVMNPDGTATILQDTNLGMQLQLQNVNGQNVLTPVQSGGVFNGSQGILTASPAGMVIRTPPGSQGKIIQQQHSPGAQFLSPGATGQIVVNGAQFSGQLSPLVASVSPSFSSAQQIRSGNNTLQPGQDYIQCNQIGQTLMVPYSAAENISSSSSNTQQGTTYVQQNTTIVQQQTTMVSNNQVQNQQQHRNVDQNIFISANNNRQHQLQAVLIRENAQNGCRQSVSTQTAVNQNAQSITTNTFCQTSTISAGSPPDTTTLSPIAIGGQSPHVADTTTHSGSTDDGLSPTPSNSSLSYSEQLNIHGHQSMAMVHCISSSEPDSQESLKQHEQGYMRARGLHHKQHEYEVTSGQMQYVKRTAPIHIACAESSSIPGMHCLIDAKSQLTMRGFEKVAQGHKTEVMLTLDNRMNNDSVTS